MRAAALLFALALPCPAAAGDEDLRPPSAPAAVIEAARGLDPGKTYVVTLKAGKVEARPDPSPLVVPAYLAGAPEKFTPRSIVRGGVLVTPALVRYRNAAPSRGTSAGGFGGGDQFKKMIEEKNPPVRFALAVWVVGLGEREFRHWKGVPVVDDAGRKAKSSTGDAPPSPFATVKGEPVELGRGEVLDVVLVDLGLSEKAVHFMVELPGGNAGLDVPVKLKVTREAIRQAEKDTPPKTK